jgi:hypothetical protein
MGSPCSLPGASLRTRRWLRPQRRERRWPDDTMHPQNAREERDRERDLPDMEFCEFEARAAGEDGGERQARGLRFEIVPERTECTAPFAVNGHHAVHGGDEQRT